jgi:F0F1-type ATP synthase membrane subunit b/b'
VLQSDPHFFVAISFAGLGGLLFWKARPWVVGALERYKGTIAKNLNDAACEKDSAYFEHTRMKTVTDNLPDEVAKLWEKSSVDVTLLQKRREDELKKLEREYNERLVHLHELHVQEEYFQFLGNVKKQLEEDVRNVSPQERKELFEHAVSLIHKALIPI